MNSKELAESMAWQIKYAPCDWPKVEKLMLKGARAIKRQIKEARKQAKTIQELQKEKTQ